MEEYVYLNYTFMFYEGWLRSDGDTTNLDVYYDPNQCACARRGTLWVTIATLLTDATDARKLSSMNLEPMSISTMAGKVNKMGWVRMGAHIRHTYIMCITHKK